MPGSRAPARSSSTTGASTLGKLATRLARGTQATRAALTNHRSSQTSDALVDQRQWVRSQGLRPRSFSSGGRMGRCPGVHVKFSSPPTYCVSRGPLRPEKVDGARFRSKGAVRDSGRAPEITAWTREPHARSHLARDLMQLFDDGVHFDDSKLAQRLGAKQPCLVVIVEILPE